MPHTIKRVVCEPTSETRKTFKAVFFKKTQLTSVSLLAGLMVVLMLGTPFLSFAQKKSAEDGETITAGQLNATLQTNSLRWFTLGVIGGPITVAVTAFRKPPLPADIFLGKSPRYMKVFTEAYESKAKSLRLRYATMGCFTGIAVATLGYTLYDNQQYGNWWWETW